MDWESEHFRKLRSYDRHSPPDTRFTSDDNPSMRSNDRESRGNARKRLRVTADSSPGGPSITCMDLGLISFLDVDCRPAVILRRQQVPNLSLPAEYENPAFIKAYSESPSKTGFLQQAWKLCSDVGLSSSFVHIILDQQWTCTSLSDTFVLVTLQSSPVSQTETPPLTNDQSPCASSSCGPLANSPSIEGLKPWQLAAESLKWATNENDLTPHQQRILDFPWHETELGPITSWTPSHRLSVSAIMRNPNPRCLYWGSGMIPVYNEACVPIFGDRHPAYLGTYPGDIFPEAWRFAEPFARKAMEEARPSKLEGVQVSIDRRGFLEECFFDSVWLPLPGIELGDKGVLNQFEEVTTTVVARRQQSLISAITEETQNADNILDFWDGAMHALLSQGESDITYALLFMPDELGSPELSSCPSRNSGNLQYMLKEHFGLKQHPFDASSRFKLVSHSQDQDVLINMMSEATQEDKVVFLDHLSGNLPDYLHVSVEGRGYGDVVKAAAVLPVHSIPTSGPPAVIVVGLNPRRAIDDRAKTFMQVLKDCLIKCSSLATLSRQSRRQQQQMDELHQSLLTRLHESQIQSRRLNERFQRISDKAPIGMFIAKPGAPKQKLYVNDEWVKTFGITREDLDEGVSWLDRVTKEDVGRVKAFLKQMVAVPKTGSIEFRLQEQFEVFDEGTGQPIAVPQYLKVTSIPELDDNGILSTVTGWILNVSQERFSQSLLQSRLEEATESKLSAERFIDMVSHEMRNPLSAILQCADGISSSLDVDSPESQKSPNAVRSVVEAAETIILCAQHQKRIVDDILTLSKLDSKLLVISPDKISPVSLLSKALKMFEAQLASADITTSITVDTSIQASDIEHVWIDSSRVLQIIINLLTNAIKFTSNSETRAIALLLSASTTCPADLTETDGVEYIPRRNAPRRISVNEFGSGEELYLTFKVRDTGKGLGLEEKMTLFQRFSQATAKTYKKYGGSGLGLFISRELTELQGGQIGVSSEAGKGSTFAFYVLARRWIPSTPHSKAHAEPPSQPETPIQHNKQLSNGGRIARIPQAPMSILVVEDNHINRMVMAKQISLAGHTVHLASNGLEALSFLQTTTFYAHSNPEATIPLSVILMDLEMPLLDGMGCVRRIRELQSAGEISGHVPVIAVTANARGEQMAMARDAGMDDVVTKPCRIGEMLERAGELVASAK